MAFLSVSQPHERDLGPVFVCLASFSTETHERLDSGIFLIAFQGPLPLSGSSLALD